MGGSLSSQDSPLAKGEDLWDKVTNKVMKKKDWLGNYYNTPYNQEINPEGLFGIGSMGDLSHPNGGGNPAWNANLKRNPIDTAHYHLEWSTVMPNESADRMWGPHANFAEEQLQYWYPGPERFTPKWADLYAQSG
eukprot:GEMP01061123.1.p2 GENE.GEMP01061123.1~~GEMP01061123.1.p2  ORF type:complete len:135 (+),score=24.47 GEMP01061123.1:236-640(+)